MAYHPSPRRQHRRRSECSSDSGLDNVRSSVTSTGC